MQQKSDVHEKLNAWFTACYDEYADPLFRFCLLKTSSRDVALDLSQEVFVKLWDQVRDGGAYDPKKIGNVRALLFTIARNQVIDYYRKKKTDSLEPMLDAGFEPEAHDNPSETAAYQEAVRAINNLDEPYREAVYLRYVEELPPRDIAAVTGEKVNTVSIRITRGMKQLRDNLNT